ncbi:unnamed protein product [Pedinophyceae sp. YPF-701]|nr:unnamed protein product [Pedinophyceae sp. YPF-701]
MPNTPEEFRTSDAHPLRPQLTPRTSFSRRTSDRADAAVTGSAEYLRSAEKVGPTEISTIPLYKDVRGSITAQGVGSVLSGLSTAWGLTPDTGEGSLSGGAILSLTLPTGSSPARSLDAALGRLHCRDFMTIYRNKFCWSSPAWGSKAADLPPETQFLLGELPAEESGGSSEPCRPTYVVLVPMLDSEAFRATLIPPSSASAPVATEHAARQGIRPSAMAHVRIESGAGHDKATSWSSVMYMAAGQDPFALTDAAVARAARLSGGGAPRVGKRMPAFMDLFGWCTWDAFYKDVSADGILRGMETLRASGVAPGFVIIDDGWQQTAPDFEYRTLDATDFSSPKTPMRIPRNAGAGAQSAGATQFQGEGWEYAQDDGDSKLSVQNKSEKKKRGGDAPAVVSIDPEMATLDEDTMEGSLAGGDGSQTVVQRFMTSVLNRLSGWIFWTYQQLVENAPPSSPFVGLWRRIAQGVGRFAMIQFYADRGDSWRLIGLEENVKFARAKGALLGPSPGGLDLPDSPPGSQVEDPPRSSEPGNPANRTSAVSDAREAAADAEDRKRGISMDGAASAAAADAAAASSITPAAPSPSKPARAKDAVGLAGLAQMLKRDFGVKEVWVWHAIMGYWGGVDPETPEAREALGEVELTYGEVPRGLDEVEPNIGWSHLCLSGVGLPKDPSRLYTPLHKYLRAAGIDGVKVDVQSSIGVLGGPKRSLQWQRALEASIATHFPNNACMNCMSLSSENVLAFSGTAVARASDDFYPRVLPAGLPHVAACAFNSMYLGAIVQPDWDMFHSVHPDAKLHATARAVSGGAIYVSDKPGKHDAKLLRSLALSDGTVLRCLLPGRPTRDCLLKNVQEDGTTALKVWNANLCGGVVAAFNVQGSKWDRLRRRFTSLGYSPPTVTASVRAFDVETLRGAPPAARFAAYVGSTGELKHVGATESIDIKLAPSRSEVVTFAPVLRVMALSGPVSFAPVGLAGMLNTGGAVRAVSQPNDRSAVVKVRGTGTFVMHASCPPESVTIKGLKGHQEWHKVDQRLEVVLAEKEAGKLEGTIELRW